jgi:L-alanine-DL-glutamate epimerase-like enolase superfamily enzyme
VKVSDYRIEKLLLPCDPAISDSHKTFDTAGVTYLELETDSGDVGVGLGGTHSF